MTNTSDERLQKLEAAVKAGMKLRRAIEPFPTAKQVQVAQLLVPIESVKEYDRVMEGLKS